MLKTIVSVFDGILFATGLDRTVLSALTRQVMVACILGSLAASHMAAQTSSTPDTPSPQTDPARKAALSREYGKLPLSFEANHGQTDAQVRFLSRGNGFSLFLTDSAAILSLRKPEPSPSTEQPLRPAIPQHGAPQQTASLKTDVVRMELAGASHGLHVTGDSQLPGTANYFIGNDPAKWHSSVPTYSKVRYKSVYPGVDLLYYGNQGQLEYDFVVGPNADPSRIGLRFTGAKRLELDSNGNLQVIAKNGQVAFHKPVVYQTVDGKRRQVEGSFALVSRNSVSFNLGPYDRSHEIVIDPTLAYSTYLGGSNGYDYGTAITTDASGDAYVAGVVYATDFPVTAGGLQAANNAPATNLFNAFIAKLNPTGTALLYATYLGGSGNTSRAGTLNHGDYPASIAVDSSGNVYVAGTAYSADFPVTTGAFQTANHAAANGVPNGFITKLNATGTSLLYSTYLGGTGVSGHAGSGGVGSLVSYGDGCTGIAIDAAGDAYITGGAYSADFPVTPGAFQSVNHAASIQFPNAFVTKLAPGGDSLLYSTYVGGSGADGAAALAIDSAGSAYIAGATYSPDFPVTSGAFQLTNKALGTFNSNAFVTKVNPTGSGLVYSTYLGGSSNTNRPGLPNNNGDFAAGLALDTENNLYIFGLTGSSDFPVTAGAYQTTNKAYQNNTGDTFFLTKLNATGTNAIYSTFVGGSQQQSSVQGLAVDAAGHAYFTGNVFGDDFPVTSDALQSSPPCVLATNGTIKEYFNPVVTEMSADGSALVYSSYLGGSGTVISTSGSTTGSSCDTAYALTLDSNGSLLVTGSTFSPDFPITSGAYQTANRSTDAAFISKMTFQSAEQTAATPQFSVPGGTYSTPQSVIITDSTAGATVYYTVDGSVPTASSTIYSSPIAVSSTQTLQAIAVASGYSTSAVATATYTINIPPPAAATPVFSPAAGTYTSAQTVTISDTTAGAAIYYTTDGTTPTSSSTAYTGSISVSSTETIKAIAIAPGYANSAVASAVYTINLPAATFAVAASPASATVTAGQSATYTITVTPQNNFAQAVSLSCPGLSSSLQCAFAPATVTPAGTAVNSTLTVSTTTASADVRSAPAAPWKPAGGVVAMSFLLWCFRRRRSTGIVILTLLLVTGATLIGCGSQTTTVQSPTSQSYTIAITAAGGGVSQTLHVTLAVTK